jgi:ribosomal protein S27AE
MGTDSKPQTCDKCDSSDFINTNDSILKRQYPFVAASTLKMCTKCGAKYIICPKCGSLFTRVHLSIDVDGVRDTCPICGYKNEIITKWISQGGGGFWEHNQ